MIVSKYFKCFPKGVRGFHPLKIWKNLTYNLEFKKRSDPSYWKKKQMMTPLLDDPPNKIVVPHAGKKWQPPNRTIKVFDLIVLVWVWYWITKTFRTVLNVEHK